MTTQIRDIETDRIIAGNNDRTTFKKAALQELASSIKTYGLAQPITIRPVERCTECGKVFTASNAPEFCPKCGNGAFESLYQIVAGERRFRAISQILKHSTIAAIVRTWADEQASAVMLAENVARTDLDPLDEARAYQHRIDAFGWSVKDCAEKAGVSTTRVLFRLKLLRLRPDLQKLVRDGQFSLGYAQILSDGDLDVNRQLIALARLRDNSSPTPTWFRKQVGLLWEEQAQDALFDLDALVCQEVDRRPKHEVIEPAHPSTTTPPSTGKTLRQIIAGQVEFWGKAALDWDNLGKSFKRQECEAAAQALRFALSAA